MQIEAKWVPRICLKTMLKSRTMQLGLLKRLFPILVLLLILSACTSQQPAEISSDHMVLQPVHFGELPGWHNDNPAAAFYALQKSCRSLLITSQPALGSAAIPLSIKDWQPVCQAALSIKKITSQQARSFFEKWFTPYAVYAGQNPQGLFTGYYLPEINVSSRKTAYYSAPLYTYPRHYHYTRQQIDAGALAHKARIIAWANPLDRFFMQIQGSGLLIIDHRQKILIGYSGKNGYPYTSIGKVLIQRGELDSATMSMQKIRLWLEAHPAQAQEVMEQDQSFVYFKKLPGKSPFGTLQIPLTPARSLAVDTRYIPLGAPLWVETTIPSFANPQQQLPWQKLYIAQDTGGAIRGIVRADLYWGPGKNSEYLASHMKNPGRYWLLLPRHLYT